MQNGEICFCVLVLYIIYLDYFHPNYSCSLFLPLTMAFPLYLKVLSSLLLLLIYRLVIEDITDDI